MNKKLSRRDFIKLMGIGVVGVATTLFIPSIFRESPSDLGNRDVSSLNDFLHFDAAPFWVECWSFAPIRIHGAI